jgi:signal transduction histidine kinase
LSSQARRRRLICRDSLDHTIGDEDLPQAFANLVDNALKFTPANGEVVIRAGQAAGQVEVSVSDTGTGIPAEDLPRIFDRFYQTDKSRSREQRGSGLGLSIANDIIQAHRGTITIHSLPGKGSTFIVTLPATRLEEPMNNA